MKQGTLHHLCRQQSRPSPAAATATAAAKGGGGGGGHRPQPHGAAAVPPSPNLTTGFATKLRVRQQDMEDFYPSQEGATSSHRGAQGT